MEKERKSHLAFSLIEVNLAIFIVAMGMLTLFSLFPAGLRQAESAHENTQEALFAEDMLSTMRAAAATIPASIWTNKAELIKDPGGYSGFMDVTDGDIAVIEYVSSNQTTQHMRYILELKQPAGASANWAAELWCSSGEYGAITNFKNKAEAFYAELFYSGMP